MDALASRVVARFLAESSDPVGYGTQKGWQHRRERDEEVERNVTHLSPHLQTLWRKTKNKFKGTPDRRYEQFLEYVHEHPEEGLEHLDTEVEKQLKKWEKLEEQERAEAAEWEAAIHAKPKATPKTRVPMPATLYDDEVPF